MRTTIEELSSVTMDELNQAERVLQYLLVNGSIDPMTAWIKCGVYRLSASIFTLRHEHGFDIKTGRRHVTNQFDEQCLVAKYHW
jgi:hypothetical protein